MHSALGHRHAQYTQAICMHNTGNHHNTHAYVPYRLYRKVPELLHVEGVNWLLYAINRGCTVRGLSYAINRGCTVPLPLLISIYTLSESTSNQLFIGQKTTNEITSNSKIEYSSN